MGDIKDKERFDKVFDDIINEYIDTNSDNRISKKEANEKKELPTINKKDVLENYSNVQSEVDLFRKNVEIYIKYNQKRLNTNNWLKIIFFCLTMGTMLAVVVTSIWCLSRLVNVPDWINFAGIISATATLITVSLALPKIMGKYLFPLNEEKMINEIILGQLSIENDKKKPKDSVEK